MHSNNREKPPVDETGDDPARMNRDIMNILPDHSKTPFDMYRIIREIVDNGYFLQVKTRFVRICDAYNIPIVHNQDSPAVMIGQNEKKKGIIKHGSKMLHAFIEASLPKITLIIRNSYAGVQLCYVSVMSLWI